MALVGNTNMVDNRSSVGVQDIETGSITEHVGDYMRASPIETAIENMEDSPNNVGHVDDIDKWVASMERILEDVPQYMCTRGHPGRISRIPENLREVDMKGYNPYIMSIGPYHNGKSRVQQMEMRKKLALKCVLKYKPELTLKDYLKEIVSIEQTARSFYADIDMESEKFVQMLLLDSVYIVITFCRFEMSQGWINEINERFESRGEEANVGETRINEEIGVGDGTENLRMWVTANESYEEMTTGDNWYWALFTHDLFLIENQIPFFILQKIFNLAYGGSGEQFLEIMKYEVANMLSYYTKVDLKMVIVKTDEVHHLLHLCHMFFIPSIQQEPVTSLMPESSQMFRLGSAVQLYEAGVHFEARSGSTNYSLIDITFDTSGNLVIPCLHVDDHTESLLRNLTALEQMKYPSLGLNISAYIVLLLHLITIPKDVELLRRKGIIQHHLASDKEMMSLVNRLSIGLAFDYVEDKYSLKHVFHALKGYSERRVPRWRAWLKHTHFSNPCTTISLLAASILLLLTFVQTYYAVYSYYHPYFNGHF